MSRRPVALAVAGLLSVAALSACGSGQGATTYKPHSYDYVNVDRGGLAIRDLAVDAPTDSSGQLAAGGTAKVTGVFVSHGGDDQLTDVSSPAAASATIQTTDGGMGSAGQVNVPAGGLAKDWTIVLSGLTQPLRSGSFIDLTLTFAKAGRTTLRVPVRANGPLAPDAATPSPSES